MFRPLKKKLFLCVSSLSIIRQRHDIISENYRKFVLLKATLYSSEEKISKICNCDTDTDKNHTGMKEKTTEC